eukprot:scaffold5911_cov80-Skeletonema_dohrnii-CCMP3373.AAC.3
MIRLVYCDMPVPPRSRREESDRYTVLFIRHVAWRRQLSSPRDRIDECARDMTGYNQVQKGKVKEGTLFSAQLSQYFNSVPSASAIPQEVQHIILSAATVSAFVLPLSSLWTVCGGMGREKRSCESDGPGEGASGQAPGREKDTES